MGHFPDTNEDYWLEYDGLQAAKHTILRKYLGGWFPILASCHGRIVYIDCHAGRGRHRTGAAGSPVLALQELLTHRAKDRILSGSEVVFLFFEIDEQNAKSLRTELAGLGRLPRQIRVHIECQDYEQALRDQLAAFRANNVLIAPTFAFVDPFGFTLSMDVLNSVLSFPRTELLINFMYRYVDMAMQHESQEGNLDSLFGCTDWRKLVSIQNYSERADATISLFASQLKARFVTHMRMMGSSNTLKYVLLHATNHEAGRRLMKDAMWATAPEGSFTASERDNPDQLLLLVQDPDLRPLEDALWKAFCGQTVSMEELYDWLLGELYLDKHLHKVLNRYRKERIVEFSRYDRRFAFSKNPFVSFPTCRPGKP